MVEQAKSIAGSIHDFIKPYEKYLGLLALAVVLDYFVLGGKFTSRFKAVAEAVVEKITKSLDTVITKLTDSVAEELEAPATTDRAEGGE